MKLNDEHKNLLKKYGSRLSFLLKASPQELLTLWRFGESGDKIFQGKLGALFAKKMQDLNNLPDNGFAVLSKEVGWDGNDK